MLAGRDRPPSRDVCVTSVLPRRFGVSLLGRVKPAYRDRVSPVFQLVQPRAPRPPVEYLSNNPCPSKVRVAARRFGPMSVPNCGLTAIPPRIIIVQRLAAGVPPERHNQREMGSWYS